MATPAIDAAIVTANSHAAGGAATRGPSRSGSPRSSQAPRKARTMASVMRKVGASMAWAISSPSGATTATSSSPIAGAAKVVPNAIDTTSLIGQLTLDSSTNPIDQRGSAASATRSGSAPASQGGADAPAGPASRIAAVADRNTSSSARRVASAASRRLDALSPAADRAPAPPRTASAPRRRLR